MGVHVWSQASSRRDTLIRVLRMIRLQIPRRAPTQPSTRVPTICCTAFAFPNGLNS
jgi:hypothetical protein